VKGVVSIPISSATINYFLTIHIQRADIVHPWAAGSFPWGLHGGNGMSRRNELSCGLVLLSAFANIVGGAFGIGVPLAMIIIWVCS
jgi:hypothetical protein